WPCQRDSSAPTRSWARSPCTSTSSTSSSSSSASSGAAATDGPVLILCSLLNPPGRREPSRDRSLVRVGARDPERASRRPDDPDRRSGRGESFAQHLGRVLGSAPGQMLDLLAAGDAGRNDLGIGRGGLHRGSESPIAEGDRDVVVLPLEAEGSG